VKTEGKRKEHIVQKEKRRNVKERGEMRKGDLKYLRKYLRKLTVTTGTCMNERQG